MEKNQLILSVKGLNIQFNLRGKVLHAIRGIDLDIYHGEVLAIVGESGSGKSVTAYSIMQILAETGKITGGEVRFHGEDITKWNSKQMQKFRGEKCSIIFQDPMTSLNPVFTVGSQLIEAILLHTDKNKKEAWARAVEMLTLVGVNEPESRMKQYPHELSGGMRQRVMIAMALVCEPDILIADEPTTALDVTIQARILQLILNLQKKLGIAVIFITHNLGVVAKIADYVNVMYAGKVVETGKAEDIFFDPRHPYTWGLLSSMPDLTGDKKERLYTIPGNPPNLANEVKGDAFAVRNPYALNIDFEEEPPMFEINEHHQAATWLLHPDAPKVEMPQTLKKRIEQLRREEKRYAETEGAYGTDE